MTHTEPAWAKINLTLDILGTSSPERSSARGSASAEQTAATRAKAGPR